MGNGAQLRLNEAKKEKKPTLWSIKENTPVS